jgi:hypothetical protein
MKYDTKDIQKEAFESAPEEVQHKFGYEVKKAKNERTIHDVIRQRGYSDTEARQMLALLN